MQGLEIALKYYNEFGRPMLENDFSEVVNRIAVGLAGEGSECFGYDDEISQDHDFEAGFCLWLTKEDYDSFGFKLERAYAKLPKEFMGIKKSLLSPVGGNRHGVITIDEFYSNFLGSSKPPEKLEAWLYLPTASLACACNGQVFSDPLGKFSEIRNELLKGYPEDVRLKKLAASTIKMAQSGQYNYSRCIKRGENGAAQLAVFEFVKGAISTIFLLNNKFEPFYKWAYKAMRDLPILGELEPSLITLTELDNSPIFAETKEGMIEDISMMIISEFKNQGLTKAICTSLEKHAYSLLDGIKDNKLRNMHIMDCG